MTSGSSLFTLGFERPPDLPARRSPRSARPTIGLGAPRAADRVPADDLQRVLPARGRGHRSRDPGRHAADAARACSCARTSPASSTSSTRSGTSWMHWFTEVQETHTSYGSLAFFRSPNPHRSWVTAAGAVLDTAAIRLAVLDIPPTPAGRGCASARATSRCARSPASSASTTTTRPRPTTRSASRATSSTRSTTQLVEAGRPGARRPRPGVARLRRLARQLRPRARSRWPAFVMAPYAPWVVRSVADRSRSGTTGGAGAGSRSPGAPNVDAATVTASQRSSKSQVSRASRRVAADEPLGAERLAERVGRHAPRRTSRPGSGSRARPSRRACGRRSRARRRSW